MSLIINATTPIEDTLAQVATQVPILFPSLLLMMYAIIVIIGSFIQKKSAGWVNVFMWLSIGGFMISISGFILFLVEGLISLNFLIILVSMTIVFTLLFLFTKD